MNPIVVGARVTFTATGTCGVVIVDPLGTTTYPNGPPADNDGAGPITLARGGQTDYTIVTPAAPTTQEQKAAEELARWLNEMTGAEFPIVTDETLSLIHI